MACETCISNCCIRWCVEELLCATDCCGCCHIRVMFGPNLDIPAGQILGKKEADKRYYPFDPFANDGTQIPRGLSKYHYETDAAGNVKNRFFNPLVPTSQCGEPYGNMYVCGIFRTESLVGDVLAAESGRLLRILTGDKDSGLVKLT